MEDIILFHGSRGGLQGDIQPQSRVRCDFGKGFYMGESQDQAKGLICEADNPIFYTLRLRLSEIPENRIWVLSDREWLNLVLANRKRSEEFSALAVAKKILRQQEKYDVIIGPIADDRMNEAMQRFTDYALTDKGLMACLQSVDYGRQFVAKTPFACSKIEILSEERITKGQIPKIREYTEQKRKESRGIVTKMAIEHQRDGLYLNEIVKREHNKEKGLER